MRDPNLKYGGMYPAGAEDLAKRRLRLREEGKYEEADELRRQAKFQYHVEIQDTRSGWTLRWWDGKDA